MKHIELRLALVLYGGVSLAVYMHGITREFLNLVRASRRREARGLGGAGLRAEDSVVAYEEFLELFAPTLDLRVVVDVISGASAGGVNGVMLARALAHNLPLDSHRDLWLENADVTRLANDPVGLTRYLKGSIAPVLDRLVSIALKAELDDGEARTKLRQFMQSRWFTPPFSGERYVGWMLDACRSMTRAGARESEPASLVPQGQALDLFVTMTDFFGARRRFAISAPGEVEETEHRLILRYRAQAPGDGTLRSDLDAERIPDLVFAARATSAFPGAFPPMTVGEMDRVLAMRGETWTHRDTFCRRAFGSVEAGEARVLVDGSVVMNKPFQPLLDAIAGRAAGREVVRRIVYVDPTPEEAARAGRAPDTARDGVPPSAHLPSVRSPAAQPAQAALPGFFRVILSSLAHIPRNEPIGDALEQVAEYNREIRRIADVIGGAEPIVEREVRAILRPDDARPMTVQELTRCRAMANERAHVSAGYAARGYQSLKLSGLVERLGQLCAAISQRGSTPASAQAFAARFEAWIAEARDDAGAASGTSEPLLRLLRGLDVDYRVRRLRFVIRRLNRLYRASPEQVAVRAADMDDLKSTLYEQIDRLLTRWTPEAYGAEIDQALAALLSSPPDDTRATGRLIDALSQAMGLAELDRLADDVFSVMVLNYLPEPLRLALVGGYVGFAFYDLVTLPVLRGTVIAEYNEIKVDRISPADANTLRPGGVRLKGASLNAFGAFFNRRWREHDYLWGRLTAADRLMSLSLAAAGEVVRPDRAAVRAARRRVFEAILDEERGRLAADPELVPALAAEVERVLGAQAETGVGEAGAAATPPPDRARASG
ncbi:patatin-like protein [Stappia sp.]|uniref:patatin-like protein n=1 Tax=Stappia sp. TaxID=1870903 RepID=UPI0032D8D1A3